MSPLIDNHCQVFLYNNQIYEKLAIIIYFLKCKKKFYNFPSLHKTSLLEVVIKQVRSIRSYQVEIGRPGSSCQFQIIFKIWVFLCLDYWILDRPTSDRHGFQLEWVRRVLLILTFQNYHIVEFGYGSSLASPL